MLVVKKVDANKQVQYIGDRKDGKDAGGKAGETKDKKKEKLNLSYVDQLVQYELRLVLKQISSSISKRRVHQLQLIYASLEFDEKNPGKMLISQSFFNEHIKRPVMQKPEKAAAKGPSGGMFGLGSQRKAEGTEEDSAVIRNSVLVCIIKTHLILLQERWDMW